VAKTHRQRKFHLSFAFVFRLLLFTAVIFLSINYLSRSSSKISFPVPDVLGETIKYLPPQSQNTLKNLPGSPAGRFIQEKIGIIKTMSGGFPQKQITDIKKLVVEKIYQSIMNSLEIPAP
jgi:hypothetical protein